MIRSLPAQQHINWQRVPIITMLAAFSAAGINSLVYGIAVLVNLFPSTVLIPAAGRPLSIAPVVAASVMGVLGGMIVFGLFSVWSTRSLHYFRIIASAVLVLSFVTPLTIPNAPVDMIVTLELMHVVIALVVIAAAGTLLPA